MKNPLRLGRRRLLQSLAVIPSISPSLAADLRGTAIESVEVFTVPVNRRGNWLLVRMRTSNGLAGIGDASHGGSDVEKQELIRHFFDLLKGRSPADVEWLRSVAEPVILKRGTAAAVAMSGLEQCMWDLQGKICSCPVYDLLGGKLRDSVRNYANINRSTEIRDPEGFARMAEKALAAGFNAVKLAPFDDMPPLSNRALADQITELGISRAAAVRKAIGETTDLLVDVHSHMDLERGLKLLKRMEPLRLFWLEEVVPAKNLHDLAAINEAAPMPTPGGESRYGVREFLPYVSARGVDITMPDVKYCGGMLELKKIAALSEAAQMPVAPHGPASPVGNMAAAHICVTAPNFHILEFSFGEVEWRADLVNPAEELNRGFLTPSSRAGLGITLNEKLIARLKG
ncbi:MAG TPA: mandelate racemase/muconate lactonizing enzyme family protein [Bryobacteraceae bacterium]|jgi:galactonate dehydratase